MVKNANIFSISYSSEIRDSLDPGFGVIGDELNPRPDWYEYWHIRQFLRETNLVKDHFYGFFSPKFKEKTKLSSEDVYQFLGACKDFDVVLFSPFLDQIALFLNVIEQGVFGHPELALIFEKICEKYFPNIDPLLMVNSSKDTVFCNYFAAKPTFWARWFEICEDIFISTESQHDMLGKKISGTTIYKKMQAPLRAFVIERIATLILFSEQKWKVSNHSTYGCEVGKMPVAKSTDLLLALDSLKMNYAKTSSPEYLKAYFDLRAALIRSKTPPEFYNQASSVCSRIKAHTDYVVNQLKVRRNISLPQF